VVVPHLDTPAADTKPSVSLKSVDQKSSHKKDEIIIRCSMCENDIAVAQSSMGKIIECPECGCFMEVPEKEAASPFSDSVIELENAGIVKADKREDPPSDSAKSLARYLNSKKRPDDVEQDYLRKFPWFIDIFLYPTSPGGLVTLSILVFGPFIMKLILIGMRYVNIGPLTVFLVLGLAFVFLFIKIVLVIYVFWFFSVCVEESARGKTRAPETLTMQTDDSVFEIFFSMARIVSCILICVWPSLVYYWETKQVNEIFWALLAGGVFFLPMMLLRVVMYESITGLNPFIIIWSIFKIFFRYCLVVVLFYLPIALYALMLRWVPNNVLICNLILKIANVYLILTAAHVLGWFFYRNEERLNWPV
jgi:Na+-transporting methylmalonyl-CoA/oxaloacetate decarboxylase gamma subunit